MKIIVGITGASGNVYAIRLLEVLQGMGHEVHLVATDSGLQVTAHESEKTQADLEKMVTKVYDVHNIGAAIASGSFLIDAMVVVPCSMKTAAAIASGVTDNLLTRAADVTLKEARPLIVVPRETPMHAGHLENLLKLTRLGARILPACPGFYHKPETLDDIVNIMVGKICDALHIENDLFKRWK